MGRSVYAIYSEYSQGSRIAVTDRTEILLHTDLELREDTRGLTSGHHSATV